MEKWKCDMCNETHGGIDNGLVTKYDVHVHEIKSNGKLGKEITGRYFYVQDDTEETIKAAIARSTSGIFTEYINNPKYTIHIVTEQENLCECEYDFFMKAYLNDYDPENFFMTRRK